MHSTITYSRIAYFYFFSTSIFFILQKPQLTNSNDNKILLFMEIQGKHIYTVYIQQKRLSNYKPTDTVLLFYTKLLNKFFWNQCFFLIVVPYDDSAYSNYFLKPTIASAKLFDTCWQVGGLICFFVLGIVELLCYGLVVLCLHRVISQINIGGSHATTRKSRIQKGVRIPAQLSFIYKEILFKQSKIIPSSFNELCQTLQ